MPKKLINNLLIVIVVIMRILAGVYIFFDVFWGYFLTTLFDYLDSYVFREKAKMSWHTYQFVDKAIDLIPYSIMLVVSIQSDVFLFLLILFIYRLVGEILFFTTKKTWYLVLFPNFFNVSFALFIVLQEIGIDFRVVSLKHLIFLFYIYFFQLYTEIWLHYVWPQYIKEHGYPPLIKKLGYKKL